jgi:hypothetical protein
MFLTSQNSNSYKTKDSSKHKSSTENQAKNKSELR